MVDSVLMMDSEAFVKIDVEDVTRKPTNYVPQEISK